MIKTLTLLSGGLLSTFILSTNIGFGVEFTAETIISTNHAESSFQRPAEIISLAKNTANDLKEITRVGREIMDAIKSSCDNSIKIQDFKNKIPYYEQEINQKFHKIEECFNTINNIETIIEEFSITEVSNIDDYKKQLNDIKETMEKTFYPPYLNPLYLEIGCSSIYGEDSLRSGYGISFSAVNIPAWHGSNALQMMQRYFFNYERRSNMNDTILGKTVNSLLQQIHKETL